MSACSNFENGVLEISFEHAGLEHEFENRFSKFEHVDNYFDNGGLETVFSTTPSSK